MSVIKWLLWPFSLIYLGITSLRNLCYDSGVFQSHSFDVFVVSVGNLSVGGTGKSPMIEYLIQHLSNSYNLAVLSRGYKRQTKGFLEVLTHHSVEDSGDEPLQFKRKFPDQVVCVDVDRRHGISNIMKKYPQTEIILLDDAFQHRRVNPDFTILLSTYDRPYFDDYLLPMGRLRESVAGAKRADAIIITKSPVDLNLNQKESIKSKIQPKSHQFVGFSSIDYADQIIGKTSRKKLSDIDDFILITGIAKPEPLLKYLKAKNKTFEHRAFSDHHHFTEKEINRFRNFSKPILTTEKDFVRLERHLKQKLYYLPISVVIDLNIVPLLEKSMHLKELNLN